MVEKALLFSHPATWVIVDDHERFLHAVKGILPDTQPCNLICDPKLAIPHINERSRINRPWFLESEKGGLEELGVKLDLGAIGGLLTNRTRYSDISVVVADYAMPGMDGVEMFGRLDSPFIKRVLLTGVADQSVAVDAFNDGRIDKFLSKNDPDAATKLVEYCLALSLERNLEIQEEALRHVVSVEPYFEDQKFREALFEYFVEYGVVEYYFSLTPRGFLGLDSMGAACFIHIVSAEELESQATTLIELSAPHGLIKGVEEKTTLSLLFEEASYRLDQEYDWNAGSISIQRLADSDWYVGISINPPIDIDFDKADSNLSSYLAQLESFISS